MVRQPLVVANWKMHGSSSTNRELVSGLLEHLPKSHTQAVICPPALYVEQVKQILSAGASMIEVGAQDCSHMDSGAFTGEVSPSMLVDAGCSWVIVGHSERRQYHQESDALVAAKANAAREAGITPVVCVGETREQREAGEAEAVVERQVLGALGDFGSLADAVVAYEPVWAIGTGLTATPEEAQDMHEHIRRLLGGMDAQYGSKTRILYGGSVKAGNASDLFAKADIDGALVGGASLDAEAFSRIIEAAAAWS
ncbi:MAG: triose-phosphate isomerase [Pseudomonadota bacterium]